MKINLNIISIVKRYISIRNASIGKPFTQGVVGLKGNPNLNRTLSYPLNIFMNFNAAEYSELSEGDIAYLRAQYKQYVKNRREIKIMEVLQNSAAQAMEESLNKKFGKGQYIVVGIGRSLSSILKVLGYRIGEENTKSISMSNARRFIQAEFEISPNKKGKNLTLKYKNSIVEKENLREFLKYLNKKGLSREYIKKCGKKVILTDYCISGDSLKGATKLLEDPNIWGKNENVTAIDFKDIVENKTIKVNRLPLNGMIKPEEYYEELFEQLFKGDFKDLSTVKPAYSLEDASDVHLDDLYTGFRLMHFKLLDNVMRQKNGFIA